MSTGGINLLASVLAVSIGGGIGIGELVARYRDEPLKAIITRSAVLYIVINAMASLGALWMAIVFDWKFGALGEDKIAATRVLVAGFGAMALFRSSLFTVRVGGTDVGVGPSSFLSIILSAADRAVDRSRATQRAKLVREIMAGIVFADVRASLPLLCFAQMQNVPEEEQRAVSAEIEVIAKAKVDDYSKALSLGLSLMNVVGEEALREAIVSLDTKTAPKAKPAKPK